MERWSTADWRTEEARWQTDEKSRCESISDLMAASVVTRCNARIGNVYILNKATCESQTT